MRTITYALLAGCMAIATYAQDTDHRKMIELGKTYKNFMFRNEPTKAVLEEVTADIPPGLETATAFIAQCITTKNKLLTPAFLSRPDDPVLKHIYIIRALNLNMREENQIDNNKLIDSLSKKEITPYELLDNYYDMLFAAVGNKNQPFNLSKTDFILNDYHLKDDTEKGILFLNCMELCNKTIWGYMNVVRPPNTGEAYANIRKFPKFNGQPYYQYSEFQFPDFQMNIEEDKGLQSYKSYYLDKYYETLVFHLICLNKENRPEKEVNDLLLGSILKDRNLYKYTQYKQTLEGIFSEHQRP